MQKKLDHLMAELKKAYREGLVSVVLYGSAAAGDHHEHFSDLNVLCVLRQIGVRELEAAEPVFRWWREQGNPSPLLMSEAELRESTDCFPIEFHDIRSCHRILHGTDVVAELPIDDRYYRAQLEHELRAKMLRLRQKAPGVLHDKVLLLRLMTDSVSTFCNLGRHALEIAGVESPVSKREALARMAERFGIDIKPFAALLDLREGRTSAKQVDARALFGEYLVGVERLTHAVERSV
ncbi:MAG: nucleotidyltransferase domain-containing protein [Acidimicrobiia bacterium]|nr:nucleotidyltransferase domain-containing protein [Acidimicrobiia bacterium]